MRFLPKRISIRIQTEPWRSKKFRKSYDYHEVESIASDSGSSDESEEAVTPRSSGAVFSPTIDLFTDFPDSSGGNFVRAMKIIKNESWRRSALVSTPDLISFDNSNNNNDKKNNNNDNNNNNSRRHLSSDDSDIYTAQPSCLDQKARDCAIYIASRIKQQLPDIFDGCQSASQPLVSTVEMVKMIADRLYTYSFFFAGRQGNSAAYSAARMALLKKLQSDPSFQGDPSLTRKPCGPEAFYAFRCTLDHFFKNSILPSQKTIFVERARVIIQRCRESEEKLSPTERECMYSFHRLMSGIDWDKKEMQLQLYCSAD